MSLKNALVQLSICLSDLPKDKMKKSEKNGKIYIQLEIRQRKEPDQFGQDIYATVSQSKEEREAKTDRIFIGNGKLYTFTEKVEEMPPLNQNDIDDLPF